MTALTASDSSGTKPKSATASSPAPWPPTRKVLDVRGWLAVAMLVFPGLIALLWCSILPSDALALAPLNPEEAFDPFEIRYYTHALATILHLGPGFFVMVLGPLQFMRPLRKHYLHIHRWTGRAFILCAAIGACSGIFIGVFYPFAGVGGQGFNEAMSVAFFSPYILFCLFMAYSRIRKRMFGQHREWMIRAFALLLAIATERLMLTFLQITTNIDIAVLFGTTFWMAIATNMAMSEMWIALTRTPGNGAQHWKDVDARAKAG